MAEVIRMPLLSDTMTEGKIVKWNKQVGDKVKSDDVLADVETDKATMEVVGYADGTLLYIGVPEGKAAQINEIIAIVGKEGEDYKSLLDVGSAAPTPTVEAPATGNQQPATTSPGVDADALASQLGVTVIRMPLLSDTMTEGKIVAWNKKVGDTVKADESLADVETDKATMEVVPYVDGTVLYTGVEAGSAAKINEVIAVIGKAGTDVAALVNAFSNPQAASSKPQAASNTSTNGQVQVVENTQAINTSPASGGDGGRLKASPLAKKIAADKGIDLHAVHGSGDGGRIIKADIDNYKVAVAQTSIVQTSTSLSSAAKGTSTPLSTFVPGAGEGFVDTPNGSMRKTIARRLGESMFTAPHFYLKMELNMDNAMAARAQMNAISPVKISFQDMMIKACAMALRKHPAVNSSWMGEFIRTYNHIHIGSAVAVDQGLIVPVFKFADQKSLSQIASEANGLYDKARTGKLQPQEFTGNTFTISNLGMMDIEDFTAIINPPDSCILAVGRIKEIVIKKADGSFGTTNVMKVTLSCDHRSVDGAVGASFLQTLKKYIENPVTMLV